MADGMLIKVVYTIAGVLLTVGGIVVLVLFLCGTFAPPRASPNVNDSSPLAALDVVVLGFGPMLICMAWMDERPFGENSRWMPSKDPDDYR